MPWLGGFVLFELRQMRLRVEWRASSLRRRRTAASTNVASIALFTSVQWTSDDTAKAVLSSAPSPSRPSVRFPGSLDFSPSSSSRVPDMKVPALAIPF